MKFYFIDKEKFNNLFKKKIFFLFLILIIFLDRLSKDTIIIILMSMFSLTITNIDLVWNNGIGRVYCSDSSIFYNLMHFHYYSYISLNICFYDF